MSLYFSPQFQYMIFHYSLVFFTIYGYSILQCDQLPDGLIAQLVEKCTGIADVMGLNPFQA